MGGRKHCKGAIVVNGLNNELGRREFLRKVAQAAAAAAVSGGIASGAVPKEKKIDLADLKRLQAATLR